MEVMPPVEFPFWLIILLSIFLPLFYHLIFTDALKLYDKKIKALLSHLFIFLLTYLIAFLLRVDFSNTIKAWLWVNTCANFLWHLIWKPFLKTFKQGNI